MDHNVKVLSVLLDGTVIEWMTLDPEDNRLRISTRDGVFEVWDGGQECCEERWMETEDDLSEYVGATIRSVEVREGAEGNWGADSTETQFLWIRTDRGDAVFTNYNSHNGYYGGFNLTWRAV